MSRFLKTSVLLLISTVALSQQGNYFLSHYVPSDERIDYLTFGMVQDARGIIYFANKNGVLEFDGRNWGLISTPGPVFTLATFGDQVFFGGLQGFGKIVIGADNIQTYQSLSQNQPEASQIFSSLSFKDKIYFANSKVVFVVAPNSGAVELAIKTKPGEELSGLMEISGNIYVNSTSGVLKIEGNKLAPPNFPWADNISIEFSASSPVSNFTLLSVSGGRLFLSSTSGLREINLMDKDFLIHNIPIAAAWLNEELIAIGTLRGGVIFINPQTGVTQEVTNFYTGLPDNEIYALLVDRHHGLWVAHDYGYSRIAPSLPFSSYSHYLGLEGSLLCAKTFQGQSYVGTTLGLFSLVKQDVVEEVFI